MDEVEAKEKEEEEAGVPMKGNKGVKKGMVRKKQVAAVETMPSPMGRRVVPKVDNKTKEKFEKETLSKENKVKRVSYHNCGMPFCKLIFLEI